MSDRTCVRCGKTAMLRIGEDLCGECATVLLTEEMSPDEAIPILRQLQELNRPWTKRGAN